MNKEVKRTITFVGVAALLIGAAIYNRPAKEITPEYLVKLNVGEKFFKDFNPSEATAILVASFDETTTAKKKFEVVSRGGVWSIPTRYNYPADGQDQLAKTATSVMHVKREELAGASRELHEQFGVIAPMIEDTKLLKGRGQELQLRKGETVIFDLIIGKAVKDRPGFFYVRKPDEDATYIAKLDINLSTKFADWIETDLLKINRDELTEIVIDDYKVDRAQGKILKGDISKLDRAETKDPWTLEGIDDEKEEVDVTKVNGMIGALDDLKIVGVRPKPKGFKPDLSIDTEIVKDQQDLVMLAKDLTQRGFAVTANPKDPSQVKLYSDQGDLIAATNLGVVYTLRFGEVFLGDDSEIEIVGADNEKKKEADKEKEEGDDDKAADKDKGAGKKSSRYLFVTVNFDESFLGKRPEKPEIPAELAAAKAQSAEAEKEPPAKDPFNEKEEGDGDKEKKADKEPDNKCISVADEEGANKEESKQEPPAEQPAPAGNDKAVEKPNEEPAEKTNETEKPAAEKPEGEQPQGDKPEGDQPPAGEGEKAKEPPKKTLDDIKREYRIQMNRYESDLKAYEAKVEKGKKQVDELNDRFENWYYVISADLFSKLHLARKDLIKEKSKPTDGAAKSNQPGAPVDFPAVEEKEE